MKRKGIMEALEIHIRKVPCHVGAKRIASWMRDSSSLVVCTANGIGFRLDYEGENDTI